MGWLESSGRSCGTRVNAIKTAVAPSLSILQQFLCREEWIERIALRDQFCTAFFTIDDTKRGNDFVSSLFCLLRCSESRSARRADVIDNDDARAGLAVITFNGSLSAVTLRFLSHDERRQG